MAGGLPTIMGGVMQGYGFADQMKTNQQRRDLLDDKSGRESELFDMQKENFRQKTESYNKRKDQSELENAGKSLVYSMDNKLPLNPEHVEIYQKKTGINISDIGSTEMDKDLKIAESIMNPNTQDSLRTPDGIGAFQRIFKKGITRMDGTKDAEGNVRLKTEVSDLIPGIRDGKSGMYADLMVTWQKPDGTTFQTQAPMTEARRDDDNIMFMPAEALVNKLKGVSLLHEAAKNDLSVRKLFINKEMIGGGYTAPKGSYGMSNGVIYNKHNRDDFKVVPGASGSGGPKESMITLPNGSQVKYSTLVGLYAKENGLESDSLDFNIVQQSPKFNEWVHTNYGVDFTGKKGEPVNQQQSFTKYTERAAKSRAKKFIKEIDLNLIDMFNSEAEEKEQLGGYTKASLESELVRRYIAGEDTSDLEAIISGGEKTNSAPKENPGQEKANQQKQNELSEISKSIPQSVIARVPPGKSMSFPDKNIRITKSTDGKVSIGFIQ